MLMRSYLYGPWGLQRHREAQARIPAKLQTSLQAEEQLLIVPKCSQLAPATAIVEKINDLRAGSLPCFPPVACKPIGKDSLFVPSCPAQTVPDITLNGKAGLLESLLASKW